MTSIVILIRHDHQVAISQRFRVFVFLAMLQAHDLSNGSDFSVLHDHLMSRFADIEKFSTKREHCNLELTLRQVYLHTNHVRRFLNPL